VDVQIMRGTLGHCGVDLHRGGTLFLGTTNQFIGPGHAGIYVEGNTNWLSYHYYDGLRRGVPTLAIGRLEWDADGWPVYTGIPAFP
jgi:arabinan endo-1,5-alpha-L-arabinosidase